MIRLLIFFIIAHRGFGFAAETGLGDAIQSGAASIVATGNARDVATAKITNKTPSEIMLKIPVGTVFETSTGAKQITLRSLSTRIPANSEATAILPTAAIASSNPSVETSIFISQAIPRLAPLLAFFDKQPDLPRPTAQLGVLIVMEDIGWPRWNQWFLPDSQHAPTPTQVAQAVDALALIKLALPELKPSLLNNEQFKRLSLRNPWARSKAMVLYGLSVDDAMTGEPSLPPDLGKLLHTAPNDNCPICRQRATQPEIP